MLGKIIEKITALSVLFVLVGLVLNVLYGSAIIVLPVIAIFFSSIIYGIYGLLGNEIRELRWGVNILQVVELD